jgi:hypothetical protein
MACGRREKRCLQTVSFVSDKGKETDSVMRRNIEGVQKMLWDAVVSSVVVHVRHRSGGFFAEKMEVEWVVNLNDGARRERWRSWYKHLSIPATAV